jgi:ectoine hydroxylase-related dioxygenase (phytanoyl-CoA dioxygenase family)
VTVERFNETGFLVVPGVLASSACDALSERVQLDPGSGGTRNLLREAWCIEVVQRLREHEVVTRLLAPTNVAVQCTYFEKSSSRNWLVPFHQDLSIPVADRVPDAALAGWSTKEGSLFVHAPVELLAQLTAVRVHLDDCGEQDGPLRVVPGSHRLGIASPEAVAVARRQVAEEACVAPKGAAMVMRPLLLHASSKALGRSRRRVLHFLFGPASLAHGLRWQHAA